MHCVEGVAPHEQRINVEAMISAGQKLIIFSPNDAVEKLLKSFYHIDRTTHRWNDWKSWFREVIWWGNKKGAYLYTNTTVEPQLAGHY